MRQSSDEMNLAAVRRGTAVVEAVLEAAREELAASGYGGLSIEAVARRAGVNKTTVYRRWPTRSALVLAALTSVDFSRVVVPDTGTVRGDLVAYLSSLYEFRAKTRARTILRAMLAEGEDPEVAEVARALQARFAARLRGIVERAVQRRELSPQVDLELLMRTLVFTLHFELLFNGPELDREFIPQLVDLVLNGAAGRRPQSPRAKRSPDDLDST